MGLDLVVFPEMSLCGYPVWDLANKRAFVEMGMRALRAIAKTTKQMHVTSVVGMVDYGAKPNGKNRNALAVIRSGKVLCMQHKTLLPNYDVFLEEIFFEPADQHHTFKVNQIKVGASICEDIWDDAYRVKPLQVLKKKGVQLALNASASPYHRRAAHIRDALIRRKAKQNHVWLIYVNQVGGQDDLVFDGRSMVSDPQGRIVARVEPFIECLVPVEIAVGEKRSFDLPLPKINETKEMYQALVLGIHDYVEKNGFQKVVVGLSGGIDSALVATLAADAIGPERVLGVTMPSKFSSVGSYRDSEALAKRLGIEFRTLAIKDSYRHFLQKMEKENPRSQDQKRKMSLAKENLQARLRALQLMYISNDENRLLLSTGNKSEMAMGYCTLYGDMCGGLAVLGDVYKTDVYRICDYRNSISPVIPEAILKKAPSAELKPNQKDQDTLPPYEQLDAVLKLYIEENMYERDIIKRLAKQRVSRKEIVDIIKKVDNNEYKRRQTPPIIRVTSKAWFGRRMPITNRFRK